MPESLRRLSDGQPAALRDGRGPRAAPRDARRGGEAASSAAAALVVVLGTLAPPGLAAQARPDPPRPGADSATVVPAPWYVAGSLRRALLGAGWRSLWLTPTDAAVFDFDTFAGGVRWTRRGGGNMSITLHLEAVDDWREYRFRSVAKHPEQAMPAELRGTPAGDAIRDVMAALFPAAPLLVPPLADALGLLHPEPGLRIMPADPRLEELWDTFAGMPGTVELHMNEGPDDEPGPGGSRKIKGTEEFLEDLESGRAHRLDEHLYLTARLLDFLINDTDRTSDNMRWARFGEEGGYRWVPVPIDRDFAFLDAGGWLTAALRTAFPKLAGFGPGFPPLEAFTYSSHVLDRRLLQRLTRSDFQAVAEGVRSALTDSVIEEAIGRMPPEWRETDAPDRIRAGLLGRREGLPRIAGAFYRELAGEVDIHGTDEADVAAVRRHRDGRVTVAIDGPDGRDPAPFYRRTFLPEETREVRVYLHGGADSAEVAGAPGGRIRVRLLGGGGDDVLVDGAGGGGTRLYDHRGDNRLVASPRTVVSTAEWTPPVPTEGLRLGSDWVPDWGGARGWAPHVGYGDASGVVLGLGPRWTRYGFRRLPFRWQASARLLYATGDPGLGAAMDLDYRLEASPLSLTVAAEAVPFSSFRFNGLGNDAPDAGPAGLVERDLVSVRSGVALAIGWRSRESARTLVGADPSPRPTGVRALVGRLEAGPVLLWSDPRPAPGAPFEAAGTGRGLTRLGLRVGVRLDRSDADAVPRRGWRLRAEAAGYPGGGSLETGFAEAEGRLAGYLPLWDRGPVLAVRVGGSAVSDGAPIEHTAWVGGRTTLRGHRWQRYRGDRAAHGSAELRAPVAPVVLLARWNLGVFALVDAGRVWSGGESPGGWHTGVGGGLWLSALDRAVRVSYARGSEGRLYLELGLPF